jgi:hypothetical protein
MLQLDFSLNIKYTVLKSQIQPWLYVGYVINGISCQFMHRYKYDVRTKITIIFFLQDNR